MVLNAGYEKYGKDAPFEDPVVRCDACQRMILATDLRGRGKCVCGNRRVRNIESFDVTEKDKMMEWGVDEKFIALFEETDDE